jgi:vacuolar-type H+-ATPase subunit C/Vma6
VSRPSRYAFILAKVYGVMARSFSGGAYRDLLRLKSLSELSERLFPGERTGAPALVVPVEVEARILRGSIDAMIAVLDYLRDPPPLLVHAARRPEYQTAKALARALAHGRTEDIRVWDLGKYSAFRIKDARDPEKTLRSSDYSWILPLAQTVPVPELENRLDRHYYERFSALAQALPSADRAPVLRLARTEIALSNAIWALRLRFFFKFEAAKALPLMIPGTSAAVKAAVSAAFEFAADAQEDWRKWRYGWLLSDQLGDAFSAPDPIRAEQKASQFLYRRARQAFHQNPFTLGPLVAFFRLKEYEASLLNVAAEAIQLSIPEQEVLAITGAS